MSTPREHGEHGQGDVDVDVETGATVNTHENDDDRWFIEAPSEDPIHGDPIPGDPTHGGGGRLRSRAPRMGSALAGPRGRRQWVLVGGLAVLTLLGYVAGATAHGPVVLPTPTVVVTQSATERLPGLGLDGRWEVGDEISAGQYVIKAANPSAPCHFVVVAPLASGESRVMEGGHTSAERALDLTAGQQIIAQGCAMERVG